MKKRDVIKALYEPVGTVPEPDRRDLYRSKYLMEDAFKGDPVAMYEVLKAVSVYYHLDLFEAARALKEARDG